MGSVIKYKQIAYRPVDCVRKPGRQGHRPINYLPIQFPSNLCVRLCYGVQKCIVYIRALGLSAQKFILIGKFVAI